MPSLRQSRRTKAYGGGTSGFYGVSPVEWQPLRALPQEP
jgi:hypothetical protein